MKSREVLKLGVRLLGLVFLYHGLMLLPANIVQFCAYVLSATLSSMFTILLQAGWTLLLAFWLLRGAPLIMRIAYPEAGTTDEQTAEATGTLRKETDG